MADFAHSIPSGDGEVSDRIVAASRGLYRMNDARGVDRLLAHGFSMDEVYRLVAPRRTLARRMQRNEPLTLQENDSLLRVERISQAAERIFGDREKAHRWLRKPCRALENVTPIALLPSESGALLVEQELGRIEHGIYV